MSRAISRYLLVVALLPVVPAQLQAADRRFGVVLGSNVGHNSSRRLQYAEQDARKLHEVLLQLGGFEPANLSLLVGVTAEEARKVLWETEERIVSSQHEGRSLFVFYFSGHADGDVMELQNGSLHFGELVALMRSSGADVRLAFIDSCQSGKLVARKGGKRGPAFDIQVADEIASSGYAIITSSADNELSQELAEIRGSVFTHYLVSALRGAGDESADGKVTLSEAYRYAYAHTVARTTALVGGGQHPMYDFKLAGRGEVPLTQIDPALSNLSVTGLEPGRVVVVDRARESMVAESEVRADQTLRLALSPGEFQVYFLRGDSVRVAHARISTGQSTGLGPGDFVEHVLDREVPKGGLFRPPTVHSVGTGFVLRRFALRGGTLAMGACVAYRVGPEQGLRATGRLNWTTAPDAGLSTGYNDFGALVGLGYSWPLSVASVRAELLAGYEHIFQKPRHSASRHTPGFAYLASAGVEIPLGAFFTGLELGAGGRVFRIREHGTVHRLDLQTLLVVGRRWSL